MKFEKCTLPHSLIINNKAIITPNIVNIRSVWRRRDGIGQYNRIQHMHTFLHFVFLLLYSFDSSVHSARVCVCLTRKRKYSANISNIPRKSNDHGLSAHTIGKCFLFLTVDDTKRKFIPLFRAIWYMKIYDERNRALKNGKVLCYTY